MKRMLHGVRPRGDQKDNHHMKVTDDGSFTQDTRTTWLTSSYPDSSLDRNSGRSEFEFRGTIATPARQESSSTDNRTAKPSSVGANDNYASQRASCIEWCDIHSGMTATYTGDVNDSNQPHGSGFAQFPDGSWIRGQWVNGILEGYGTQAWPNGDEYCGHFKANAFNGRGAFTWTSGECYIGDFVNGYMHGCGHFSWTDGREYRGKYKDGRENGLGILFDNNGNVIHGGEWKDGDLVKQTEKETKAGNDQWKHGMYVSQNTIDSKVLAALEVAAGCSLQGRIEMVNGGQIVKLDLSWCFELTTLPPEIDKLSKLIKFDLNGCMNLVEIPPALGELDELEELNLSGCRKLTRLPCEIAKLCNLTRLVLTNCKRLEEIPPEVGNLLNLKVLNLGGCERLKQLPPEIGQLTQLEVLGLGGCANLRSLPHEIRDLFRKNKISIPLGLMGEGDTRNSVT